MNLTKIEKPFGLLSKKKQAGLVAYSEAGGTVEVYIGAAMWVVVADPLWDEDCSYRGKPVQHTKPQIPWDIIADEWICAARDLYGIIYAYDCHPCLGVNVWKSSGKEVGFFFLKIDHGTCDWKDSLVYRPGHEPEASTDE